MIYEIIIEPNIPAHRYKQPDNPIAPGRYYCTRKRLNTTEKRKTGAIAAQVNGNFCWLFPPHPYVQRVLTGYIPPEPSLYQTETEFDQKIWPEQVMNLLNNITLRPFQREFVLDAQAFFKKGYQYKRGMIAKMGGGKTLTGLLLGNLFDDFLVFADTYYQNEWIEQAQKFGLNAPRLSTYQSAHKVAPAPCVIIDEGNAVSNPRAQRTKRVAEHTAQASCAVIMTGTPISVSQMQIRWLNIIKPGQFPENDTAFKFIYGLDTALREVKPGVSTYVTEVWDIETLTEHASEICLIADTSSLFDDVLEPVYKVIETPKPKHYEAILAGAATTRNRSKALTQALCASDGHIINDMGLPQDIDDSKLKIVKEFIDNVGEPVFVVAHWDRTQARLEKMLKNHNPAIIGKGTDEVEKARFMNGQTKVLITSFNRVKGLNLHEHCRITAIVSNGTSPLNREQLEARTYRPGQKGQCIFIDFCAKGTLDSKRLELLKTHEQDAQQFVIEGLKHELNKMISEK